MSEATFTLTVPGWSSASFSVQKRQKFYVALEHHTPHAVPSDTNGALTASISLSWTDDPTAPPQLKSWCPVVTISNQNVNEQMIDVYLIFDDGQPGKTDVKLGETVTKKLS
jgi:hypothetical protein